MNIFQRINEVRKLCAYIQKDKKVDVHNYMAVTHDHVTAELRPHFVEQGIVVVPRLIQSNVADTGTTTSKNIPIIRYEARYEIDFVNVDDPQDKVTVSIEAHANDQGDKAPGKATSYATKYAMLKLFSIETGENEEERPMDAKIRRERSQITPAAGALERLTPDRRDYVDRQANSIIDCFSAEMPEEAFKVYSEVTDADEKVAVWSYLDSKMRSTLKKIGEAHKPQTTTAPPREKDLARAEARGNA